MEPGGCDRGIWASERVYRALIRLYPDEVRRRYAEEMVGYFGTFAGRSGTAGVLRGGVAVGSHAS